MERCIGCKHVDKSVVDLFNKIIEYKVGSGENTWFWHSMWIDDKNLKEGFPEVYDKSSNKNGRV